MKFHLSLLTALGLGACASLPSLPLHYGAKVTDVVSMLTCEIAMSRSLPIFERRQSGWKAAANMDLKLLALSGATVGPSANGPLGAGLFVASGNLGRDAVSKRNANFKFDIILEKANTAECDRAFQDSSTEGLKGGLGVHEWLKEVNDLKVTTGTTPYEMTYIVEFQITHSSGFNPRVSLLPIGKSTLGVGLNVSSSNSSTNTLTLSFKEIPVFAKPEPTEVVILSLPGSSGKAVAGKVKALPRRTPAIESDAARKALENAIDRDIEQNQKVILSPF